MRSGASMQFFSYTMCRLYEKYICNCTVKINACCLLLNAFSIFNINSSLKRYSCHMCDIPTHRSRNTDSYFANVRMLLL